MMSASEVFQFETILHLSHRAKQFQTLASLVGIDDRFAQSQRVPAEDRKSRMEDRMALIRGFRDLDVYKSAREQAKAIFELTKGFPLEERFS
jgi:hypothetical protein